MQVNSEILKDLAFPGINHDSILTLSETSRSTVLKHSSEVAKCHLTIDKKSLAENMRTIQEANFKDIFLQPNSFTYRDQNERIGISYWPAAERMSEDKLTNSTWSEIGRLLSKLHSTPIDRTKNFPTGLFSIFSEVNEKIAICFKHSTSSTKHKKYLETISQAWTSILTNKNFHIVLKDIRLRQKVWTHGDFHLGQIVFIKVKGNSTAVFIDVDTICLSIPEWDLARPAALFAAGILPADSWQSFIESYAGHSYNDPVNETKLWSNLDVPAKVMIVKLATSAVLRAAMTAESLDDSELQLIETCEAISRDI